MLFGPQSVVLFGPQSVVLFGAQSVGALGARSIAVLGLDWSVPALGLDWSVPALGLDGSIAGFGLATLAVVFAVVAFGGLVKGLAGFGYAVASTTVLATLIDPSRAVVVMIVPAMAANLALLGELDREGFRACLARFWPFVAAAVAGTLAGMALLGRVPTGDLALLLGVFTLGYVAFKQERVTLPGEATLAGVCFRSNLPAKVGFGAIYGLIFGASNVGVQVVAYLDALDLDRSTFVGVLAIILVGVSTVRVGAAASLGLYAGGGLFAVSVVAALPGIAGVKLGEWARERLPESAVGVGVLVLLAVIGVRLVLKGGFGI